MAEVKESGVKEPAVKEKDQIKSQPAVGAGASTNSASTNKKKAPGLTFRRLFTKPGVSPYDGVEWELAPLRSPTPRAASSSSRRTSRSPKIGP